MEALTNIQKNGQVDLLFSYMGNPDKEKEFEDLLAEIVADCRLFGSHLKIEMEEHQANPKEYTMEDVKSSCRRFRREDMSNVFGWANRKIAQFEEKDHKQVDEYVNKAKGVWSNLRNKATEIVADVSDKINTKEESAETLAEVVFKEKE